MMRKLISCFLVFALLFGLYGFAAAEEEGVSEYPEAPQFADTAAHWAAANIDAMTALGVIQGFPDGTFRPEETLTRAQFLTMCVRFALGEPEASVGDWWATYFAAAEEENWTLPFTAEDIGKPITRQEMAVLLDDAVNAVAVQRETPIDLTWPVLHQELAEMADYALLEEELASGDSMCYTAMKRCIRLGLIGGYPDGTCKPLHTLTRAEAATVLCRLDRAKDLWEEGGQFVVFSDSLSIWQTYDEEGTVIHSAKNGAIISEIAVTDRAASDTPFRFDILNANSKYFWGECGFYEYDESGAVTQLTDLPAIDYGYDVSDGSIVFLTHDPATRVIQTMAGAWFHAADSVARLHADGSVEVLLTSEACSRITREGEIQPGVLTKVERATGGEVWVRLSYVMGMADEHIYRVVIENGKGIIVPTGLAGDGYSY